MINDENENFEDLLNQSLANSQIVSVGDVVKATVISVSDESVYLDLGTRENGIIQSSEFTISGKLTIAEGDAIEVMVQKHKGGIFYCTRTMESMKEQNVAIVENVSLRVLKDAFDKKIAVEGKVTAVNTGGFEVLISDQRAFCPISQIDVNYCDNPDQHINKTYHFRIIQYEDNGKNLVVSRKVLLKEEDERKKSDFVKGIKVDSIHQGIVTAVKDYGLFVNIGDAEGLLHVSEISHERNVNAAKSFAIGDKIEVMVLSIDQGQNKISLSRKRLLKEPWQIAMETLKIGQEVKGKVTRLKPYGAFIELFPGIEGLLHISKLGGDKQADHPKQLLRIGQEVNVRVEEINHEEKRISLTMEELPVDYSVELKRLKNEQESELKQSNQMGSIFDQALKNEQKQ
jgi:small subunit ribosomal protein S1